MWVLSYRHFRVKFFIYLISAVYRSVWHLISSGTEVFMIKKVSKAQSTWRNSTDLLGKSGNFDMRDILKDMVAQYTGYICYYIKQNYFFCCFESFTKIIKNNSSISIVFTLCFNLDFLMICIIYIFLIFMCFGFCETSTSRCLHLQIRQYTAEVVSVNIFSISSTQSEQHDHCDVQTQISPVLLAQRLWGWMENKTVSSRWENIRELNDWVWPEGIALHQEAHLYMTPILSRLRLTYLLTKLQAFKSRSALKHAVYGEEVKATETRKRLPWNNFSLECHLWIICWEADGRLV